MRRSLTVVVLVWFVCCAASAETLVQNGGFEAAQAVKGAPSADQGFGVWKLGEGNLAPGNWTLNPALPGELSVLSTGAHSGKNCVRIRGSFPQRPAHLFQPCPGVKAGKWYVVRAWVRSGRAKIGFYEYFQTGPMRTPTVLTVSDATDKWQECSGYYLAPSEGFKNASLAIMVDPGQSADVDDVQVEEAPAMPAPADLPPIVLENDLVRMKLSPLGALDEFACKKTGVDYAVKGMPLFTATRRSGEAPVRLVERKGDRLEVAFADPSVKATLKLTTHRHYFTLAVERVTGDDVNWVQLCNLRL
ncbi:MAG: hypothetical protein FJ278_22200, partial [Planctomycetes bacterium]|nr:hypothetical protein [Planctomycetota bacterium]